MTSKPRPSATVRRKSRGGAYPRAGEATSRTLHVRLTKAEHQRLFELAGREDVSSYVRRIAIHARHIPGEKPRPTRAGVPDPELERNLAISDRLVQGYLNDADMGTTGFVNLANEGALRIGIRRELNLAWKRGLQEGLLRTRKPR